jgi:hypothetical protein
VEQGDNDEETLALVSVSQSTANDVTMRNSSLSFRTTFMPAAGIGNMLDAVAATNSSTATVTTSSTRILSCNPDVVWYAQFNDTDWDDLRRRVQIAQRSLYSPPTVVRTFPLPPRIPALVCPCHDNHDIMEEASNAEKALQCGFPSCFLCPLCQDVLVGAISLECGCQSQVCASCWEYRCVAKRQLSQEPLQLALELDYVIVPPTSTRQAQHQYKSPICPCCYQDVDDFRPCHALDVAISQLMIHKLELHQDPNHHSFYSVWESYLHRVETWRDELVRRQVEGNGISLYQEQHLALLLEEEESFWKRKAQRRRRRAVAIAMPGYWGVAVAVVASVGMKVLLAQSIRAIRRCPS